MAKCVNHFVGPGTAVLTLEKTQRDALWTKFLASLESYYDGLDSTPVAPRVTPSELRQALARFDFTTATGAEEALDFALRGMREGQLHTTHPAYFGVFNPCPTTMGVLAEAIAAGFNPQLASWTSGPFAIEVEQHVLKSFGARFGYAPEKTEGSFTSGGTEANHTALLVALARHFPETRRHGLRALKGLPTLYVSTECHHSFLKAARSCGLGGDAVREIPVGPDLRMDVAALEARIAEDRARGELPFFVVATAGATSGGTIDPIDALARVAEREGLWLHADAAWGGAAILVPELRALFDGIERADSITLDAHKWLSVPMTAGLFLTRHPGILESTFRVDGTHYMPPSSAAASDRHQPYAMSMAWSRRFTGLKVFLSLAVAGWDGYADVIRHQVAMGRLLREKLLAAGWEILNPTPLPVACFVDGKRGDGRSADYLEKIARKVGETGKTWVTTTHLSYGDQPALRAGIANYKTTPADLDRLIETLETVRGPSDVAAGIRSARRSSSWRPDRQDIPPSL